MGDDGSSVRYPERFLLAPSWASGGMMETMGPEKVLPLKAPQGRRREQGRGLAAAQGGGDLPDKI